MTIIYEGDPRLGIETYRPPSSKNRSYISRLARALLTVPRDVFVFLWHGLARRMDTVTFSAKPDYMYKLETIRNWTEVPCGSSYSDRDDFSHEHFRQVEEYRYATHGWLKACIESFDIQHKKVLEIGYGAGSDHCLLARNAGEMHGIDLTPRSREVTTAHLRAHNLTSSLVTGDAELLPYESAYFDFVYSFGVIHHSPNTEQVVSEIHRVLKPGGKAFVTVYNKNSLFFWWTVFLFGFIFRGGWIKRSLPQQLSLIEYPNTNEDLVIRLYTQSEVRQLFRNFSACRTYVRHLNPCDIDVFSRLYKDPLRQTALLRRLEPLGGWYVVAEISK
jgi:ubiquinone/menaquinone biosynthesis C-methylase UbiE